MTIIVCNIVIILTRTRWRAIIFPLSSLFNKFCDNLASDCPTPIEPFTATPPEYPDTI